MQRSVTEWAGTRALAVIKTPFAFFSWRVKSGVVHGCQFLLTTLILLTFGPAARGQSEGVLREVYTGLTGSSIHGLTNDSSFPDFPAATEVLTNAFESPQNVADYYGQRLRALLVPPATGSYVFWIAADDAGLLYLSPDESPYDKQPIASLNIAAGFQWWYHFPSQQSTNIYLEAGRRYYLEALHSAGQGDDFVSVGWKLPGGALEQPIPASRLRPFGLPAAGPPVFTSQPANLTVPENAPATFRVGVNNLDAVNYQWQRNGADLPGALGASCTIPLAGPGDTGARFRCVVSNAFGLQISAEAVLTVVADTTPPALFSVANLNATTVRVTFSEPVEPASATNLANYSINNGAALSSATFGPSSRVVHLTTSPLVWNCNYTVTITNVRDRAAARNLLAPNSQPTFTAQLKGIYREIFTGIPGSDVADLTNSPAFPNHPASAELMTGLFETTTNVFDNYGQRLRARILPPATGNYTFWLAADDTATLFLGTSDSPASARPIAFVTAAAPVSSRQWDVQPGQKSAPIPLVAGQTYYLEALTQDGVTADYPPDHLAVRWQLPDGSFEEPISVERLTPYGMNPPLIAGQPANTVAAEGATASFSVTVSNLDPISFQWLQNGVPIPGATNATYTTPLLTLAENGATFQCVLSNPIGATNTIGATLSVTADVEPPAFLNVLNNGSNRVVVFFSEAVEAATATNPASYHIEGATISAVTLLDDNASVALTTSPLGIGSSYTLTVSGVRDRAAAPNTIAANSQWFFRAGDFFTQDIGSPPLPGSIAFVENGVNIVAGGGDLRGTNDQFNYSYQQRRGDFDVKVRVQRLDFADTWSLAGLMARETLTSTSRYAGVFSTPSIAGSFFQYRTNAGGDIECSGAFPVNYPYTWLRLQRVGGNRFTGYASYDGQLWSQLGTVYLPLPSTIYLGFAVASHNPSQTIAAQFRDFGDSSGDPVGSVPAPAEPPGPSSRRTGLAFTEIMYHPAPRADGRSLEFVELFNSKPFPEDISGFRLSGDVAYTFPPGTVLPGGAFLVIARNPADVQAVYGIPNVTGPYTNNFSNKSGTVRLRNRQDAILLEVNYDSKPPWPAAADGAGHSLVLACPSYGEGSAQAWAQSDAIGGSPGRVDGFEAEPARNVVINEFLAHTEAPDVDFVELYNHSTAPVNLSGCWLSDDPATNKFRIPEGTVIGAMGFVSFTEPTLGFGFSSAGEAIFLVNSNRTRVLDSIAFDGQERGVSVGRYPDGAPAFQALAATTPGAPNAPLRIHNIVINEIMYHPVTDDDNDEFVELYNRGPSAVSLAGWRFTDGIDFTFPTNTVVPANAYLVVAKNAAHLMANYPNLNTGNTVGDFEGTLRNSGERISLSMRDYRVTTNSHGALETNVTYIVVDEVTFGTGGRWGKWSDGGGSSLELIDPRSDNRLAANWADSDDTAKSAWTLVTVTGILDNVPQDDSKWNSLQINLLDPGECLVDDVDVRIAGSGNLVTNATFESGLSTWFLQGDHRNSFLENSGYQSSRSLHVVATDRGDTGANRIYTLLNSPYTTNVTGTISARVKWLHGRPEILFRLRGNHLELPGTLLVPPNLGTPGARNSRWAANVGPAISEVTHSPVVPAANQSVVVTARVHDPDSIASVQLVYRVDPFGAPVTIPMGDAGAGGDAVAGDGVYSAIIPGQPNNTLVAFYLQATDGFSPAATARFPNDAPARECLVHFGGAHPPSGYGTYRFWLTQASIDAWTTREKLSNEDFPGTFVYGNFRVIYNAGSHFAASPFHADQFDSPIGTNCDYQIDLPPDDTLLNANAMRLQMPGNAGRDPTCQGEQTAFWIAEQLGLPSLHRRSVNLFVNGLRRGIIYEDTQRPNADYDEEWFPNDDNGDLYKIGYWFEFDDLAANQSSIAPASLAPFTTTDHGQVVKKLARYRQTFYKRAVKDSIHNYTNLFHLVDAVNTPATGDDYVAQVYPVVDVTEWARAFAVERMMNNTDLYGNRKNSGNPGGQNAFIFKPTDDTWKFYIWDIDFAFAGRPTDYLFNFTDAPISNMFSQPLVLRTYWQALEDAANGPLVAANINPGIDARYAAFQASGIAAAPPDYMKNFLAVRREHILWLLSGVRAGFAITSNGGNSFTNPGTLATLSGTAPISARGITINGVNYPLTWTSITNWTVQLSLTGQVNNIVVQGQDAQGNALSNATAGIDIYYNGPVSRPEDSLVINEIMFNPTISNADYVEIYNRSLNTAISLFNYRLQGVDFNFSPGAILRPQSFLLVVKDIAAFQAAYGTNLPVAGEFNGNLDPDGETLTLVRQARTTNEADLVIDKVKYGAAAPWPPRPATTNSGVALQLIDAAQDNARVSNWDDGSGWRFFSATAKPGGTQIQLYLDATGDVYLDDLRLVFGSVPGVGSNYVRNGDFEAPLSGTWSFLGSSGANTSTVTNTLARSGSNSLHLIFTRSGDSSHCLYQDITSINTSSNYTLSFWYRSATNATTLTVRVGGSSFSPAVNLRPVFATPGATNSVAGMVSPYPLLWLNEVQPINPSGLADNTGTPQPWIELFNSGTNALALDGCFLSKSCANLNQWAFPTGTVLLPGEFRVVFADGQPQLSTGTVLHTSFRLDPTNGSVVLSRGQQILDYLNYTNMEAGLSFGPWPDGQLFDRQAFYFVTPGASNNPAPVPIAINEWMASNTRTLLNPARARYDDWFELYNFGSKTINLSGYYLTDDLGSRKKWRIPNGITLAPYNFLLCWADNNNTGTNTVGNALHTSFQLSKSADEIGLFSPEGLQVDAVAFGPQFSDVSQGRYADGNVGGVYYFMPTPTPQTNNVITNNLYAPVLDAISDYAVEEGANLTFTARATDADTPAQTLTYTLLAGAPQGAGIHPLSGVFTWTPSESQGPGSYPITVQVSDNGGPPLSDARTFTVTVNEVNSPPVIGPIAEQTVDPGSLLSLPIPATDSDWPPQTLTYAMPVAPSNAVLSAAGLFTWTPVQAQHSTTNLVVVTVTDNGVPVLSATQSFIVVVGAGNICAGYKGDVSPRPDGNGAVSISDWVQVGRFAAGLAEFSNACEFARADCAPKPCGNGAITISDWVQAGRYAAGLDPLTNVCPGSGGGLAPLFFKLSAGPLLANDSSETASRTLVVSNMVVAPGQTNYLPILLVAQGDENALGFGLSYETNLLTFLSARLGDGASGAYLNVNKRELADGRVGLALALPAEQTFAPGSATILEVAFRAAGAAESVTTPVTLGDQPIAREVVDMLAAPLPADYRNGTVTIISGIAFESITFPERGQVRMQLIGAPGRGVELRASPDLEHWEWVANLTNITGRVEFTDTVATNATQRFYRAVLP